MQSKRSVYPEAQSALSQLSAIFENQFFMPIYKKYNLNKDAQFQNFLSFYKKHCTNLSEKMEKLDDRETPMVKHFETVMIGAEPIYDHHQNKFSVLYPNTNTKVDNIGQVEIWFRSFLDKLEDIFKRIQKPKEIIKTVTLEKIVLQEKIVEKIVERIVEKEVIVEKVVEKIIIEKPETKTIYYKEVDINKYKEKISSLKNKLSTLKENTQLTLHSITKGGRIKFDKKNPRIALNNLMKMAMSNAFGLTGVNQNRLKGSLNRLYDLIDKVESFVIFQKINIVLSQYTC
jgi:hypothetical protein